jgi:predicted DNA-binding protein (MmcQ/YjbR family)
MRDHRGLPPQQAAHWDTVTLDGSVLEDELLDHSYELVVARLPRAERGKLNT